LGSVNGAAFLGYVDHISFSIRDGERRKEVIYLEGISHKRTRSSGKN
jgi:hypothetical protein